MASGIFDRFDFRATVNFTGYAERARLMDAEFKRVGLEDVYRIWNFPCPFDKVLQDKLAHVRLMGQTGFFNSVMGHYRAIKTAYCLGSERCLVMEDDIRFLSDLDMLSDVVDDVPDDYDIALFDVLRPQKITPYMFERHLREDRVGKYWVKFVNARSAGCYSMSRKAMERWIGALESPAIGNGGKMRLADQYFNLSHTGFDLKAYHAAPVAARQVLVGTGSSNSGFSELDEWYRSIGCDPLAYGSK